MRLVELLPERFHAITKELAKFGTIGLINLVINFAVSNILLLTVLRSGEVKAKAVAAIVATTCAYFMNRHWTYRDRPKSTLHREYGLFFFFNAVGLLIETSVVAFTKYGLHQTHLIAFNISTAVGIGLGTLFRFWAYRTHVFKEQLAPETPAALEDAPLDGAALDDAARDGVAVDLVAAPVRAAPALVVTATPGGSVVIKVVDAPFARHGANRHTVDATAFAHRSRAKAHD